MIEKVCPFHGIPTPEGKCMRKEFNEKKGEMEECRAIPKDSTTIYWCKEHRIPIFDRKCACCERDKNEGIRKPDVIDKIEYIGTDLRLVFPEEQLLLGNILDIDKPLEMIGKSVWYNGHSYIVDGEKVKILIEKMNSLSLDEIKKLKDIVEKYIVSIDNGNEAFESKMDYSEFDKLVDDFVFANKARFSQIEKEAIEYIQFWAKKVLDDREEQWKQENLSLGDKSRANVHKWKERTQFLPEYLSDETVKKVEVLGKEADEIISEGKIEDVIFYFDKLDDNEKKECLEKLQNLL